MSHEITHAVYAPMAALRKVFFEPDAFIEQVATTMRLASWHTYQVLTKRPERLKK